MNPEKDNMVCIRRCILVVGGGFFIGLAIVLFLRSWSALSNNVSFDATRFGLAVATLTLGLLFLSRATGKPR